LKVRDVDVIIADIFEWYSVQSKLTWQRT